MASAMVQLYLALQGNKTLKVTASNKREKFWAAERLRWGRRSCFGSRPSQLTA